MASELVTAMLDMAMRAGSEYCGRNGISTKETGIDLFVAVKREVKVALSEAISDYEAAMACGMVEIATQTFAASMSLADIAAAKSLQTAAAVA